MRELFTKETKIPAVNYRCRAIRVSISRTSRLGSLTNMKTGEVYKDDSEWKAKGIAESDIRKDVRVIMPSLDLFGETK